LRLEAVVVAFGRRALVFGASVPDRRPPCDRSAADTLNSLERADVSRIAPAALGLGTVRVMVGSVGGFVFRWSRL